MPADLSFDIPLLLHQLFIDVILWDYLWVFLPKIHLENDLYLESSSYTCTNYIIY